MKTVMLLLVTLFIPIVFLGQQPLTGLWTGTLTNDSVTVRKQQSFEIALTQYKEKVYGYSRSSFIVNDTLYYVVKRVKGTVDGDICEVKEENILSSNFPVRPDKGVKVTITFRMNKQDSSWLLAGDWKTNKTKNFYSISGTITLAEEKDLSRSKLLPHLEELKVADDVPFYAETKKIPAPAIVYNKPLIPEKEDIAIIKSKPSPEEIKKTEKKQEDKPEAKPVKDVVSREKTKTGKGETKKESAKPELTREKEPVATNSPVINAPVAAAYIHERKTVAPQIVNFKSDSLQLSIYDNGEIDGDTVSILLNGEIIMARQGLKASAIKKTIYIPAGSDSVSLVLYAENLGKYPPNTGLLVVRDGEDVYQIRFSADLQQNAAIVFRRKR